MSASSWPIVSFGEIVDNCNARRVPIKSSDRESRAGAYPYYGASGIIDTIDDFLFDGEHLLIGEDGANLLARSTPIAFRAQGKFWVNNHAHIVRFNGKAELRFLEHFFTTLDLAPYVTGSAQPKLTRENLDRIPVPLPPLPEQRRIADILDKADAIRRKRKQAITLSSSLVQSHFLDMFGDPRIPGNRSRLPTTPRPMGELTRIRTGKLDANAADFDGVFPFFTCAKEPLRIDDAAFDCKAVLVAGNGDLNVKYYEGKFNAYQRTYVIESINERVLAPKFLFAFLDIYVSELRKQSIGGVIKYIKLPYLTGAMIPLPSPEVQTEFVRKLDATRTLEASTERSYDATDHLFSSLVDRAFRGELTSSSTQKRKQLGLFGDVGGE